MDDKRTQIKKYFKPFPKWGVVLGVIGLLSLMAGTPGVILGLVLIGIGGWAIFNWSQKPSDQQLDAWIEEDLKGLNAKALNKGGTDASELVGEAVVVTGPRLRQLGGADLFFKKGKDNVIRFTPIDVSIMNFTPGQLVSYQCALDLTTGNPLNEGTGEYFYKDVVSVSTEAQSLTMDAASALGKTFMSGPLKGLAKAGKLQFDAAETFVLRTAGGKFEVMLSDPALIKGMGGGQIPTTRAEKAIQTVRKMVRERKSV